MSENNVVDSHVDGARKAARMSHLVGLGQSNEQGAQSTPVVSGADLGHSALMYDRGIQTRSETCAQEAPKLRAALGFAVTPLTPVGYKL